MPVPQSKDELLREIDKNFSLLSRKLDDVDDSRAFAKILEGHARGTRMSVADLVSYLLGWGELVLHWHEQEARGEEITFPAAGFKWNELGRLAQKFYRDYEHVKSFPTLKDRLHENNLQLMFLVESFRDEDLYGRSWYGKWTRGRMIQFNTSSPYRNAGNRLNKLRRS